MIIDACQSALMRLVKRKPNTIFSSPDPTVQEVADLVNEVATFIIKKHDWQALTLIHTITGDGVTAAFPKPQDYDRMVLASDMNDPLTWFWGYQNIPNVTEWLQMKNSGFGLLTPGAWTLLGDQFQFLPVPSAGRQAQFPYISKNYARSAAGQPKAAFTADNDTFVLSERLLTLGLVFMWRQQKRLDSSQEEVDFMTALSEEAARDKGARVIRSRRVPRGNFHPAWPWPLG